MVDLLEDEIGTCYVLEVNTAPGMDETTAQAYGCAIKEYVAKRRLSV
jgi:glutathione synthase/RimK-type ligase-like ATP-grasp enzyme